MIWHHVAQCPGSLVVAASAFHTDGLRRGDLNVVDVAAIPDGLEDSVAEAKNHQVLHRLFAEVVVDAVDLAFVQYLPDLDVQRACRLQIAAEGFFDDDPAPLAVVLTGQS